MKIQMSEDLVEEMLFIIFDIDYDYEDKNRINIGNKLKNNNFDFTDEEIKNWLLPELYYSIDKDTWTKKMKNEAKKILEAVQKGKLWKKKK